MRLARERNDDFVSATRQSGAHFHVQRTRLEALAVAFSAAGVDWAGVPVIERFDHTVDDGASAARQLLDAYPQITAVICTSDILALGAMAEAERRGLRVPQDLTVTGRWPRRFLGSAGNGPGREIHCDGSVPRRLEECHQRVQHR